MDEVDVEPVDLGLELRQRVELDSARRKSCRSPSSARVPEASPAARLRPILDEFLAGESRSPRTTPAQVVDLLLWNLDLERPNFGRGVDGRTHDTAIHRSTCRDPAPLRIAVVTNQFSNQDATDLANTVTVTTTALELGPDSAGPVVVTVVEPEIAIDKTVVSPAGAVDAGDVIDYQVVLTNTGTSDAFDVTFSDVAPDNTLLTGTVTAVDGAGNPVGSFAITGGGTGIEGSVVSLAVGASITLTYSVTVQDTITASDAITNVATVDWTSTPGANPDERTGADGPGPDETVLNNYEATDTTTLATAFTIDIAKQHVGSSVDETLGSELAVGETADFEIELTLTQGTTPGVVVVDQLPDGFVYTAGTLAVTSPDASFDPPFDPSAVIYDQATGTLTITLGAVTIIGGDDGIPGAPDTGTVTLTYSGVVTNQFSNQDATDLANTVTVTTTAPELGPDSAGPVVVTVVEPEIAIDKTVVSPAGAVDAGDVIDYQVVLTNTGTSDAFDVTFSDVAPTNTLLTGTVTAVDGAGNPVGSFAITGGGTGIEGSVVSLAVGASITLTYSIVLADTVEGGDLLTNEAEIDWTSTPGANPDERTGADGPGLLNDYVAQDAVVLEVGQFPLTVEKTVFETNIDATTGTDVAVGEVVTFAVRVNVAEGTTRDFELVDVLPAGQRFIPALLRYRPADRGGR